MPRLCKLLTIEIKSLNEKLLEPFWRKIDPLTPNAQFCDTGNHDRSAIFYHGRDVEAPTFLDSLFGMVV
jgi:peptide methionine sulfoxide reductase MsrA